MRTKDGVLVPEPGLWIKSGGVMISNPTEEQLVAAGYLPYAAPAQVEPTSEEVAAAAQAAGLAEARRILEDLDAVDAVRGVLARVGEVTALGVATDDWSFQGITAAAEEAGRKTPPENQLAILQAAVALRTAWDRIVYHVGDMRRADELWPYLYAGVAGLADG